MAQCPGWWGANLQVRSEAAATMNMVNLAHMGACVLKHVVTGKSSTWLRASSFTMRWPSSGTTAWASCRPPWGSPFEIWPPRPRLSACRKSKQRQILSGSISGAKIDTAGERQYVMKRKKKKIFSLWGVLKLLTHSISLSLVSHVNS